MHQTVKTFYALAFIVTLSLGAISLVNWVNDKVAVLDEDFISSQVAQVASPLSNGLSLYYKFDETSGTNISDYSGNGKDGTTVSSPVLSSDSKVGTGAITFSGTNKVTGPNIGFSGTDFSLSFWMKTTSPYSSFIGVGYNTFCSFNSKALNCTVDGNSTGGATVSDPSIYSGSWHHIVYVVTGSTQKIYVDGTEKATATETPLSPGGYVSVGIRIGGSSGYTGSIDDVRVYSRALTTSEISTLASGSLEGGVAPGSNVSSTQNTTTQTSTQTTTQTQLPVQQAQTTQNAVTTNPTNSTLTIVKLGDGTGIVTSPSGINCGSQCSLKINTGAVIRLNAGGDTSSTFTGWNGGNCSSSGNDAFCTVTLTGDTTVSATFTKNTVSTELNAPGQLQITESNFAHATSANYDDIEFYLRWVDTNSNEDGYIVERSINGGAFSIIKTLGPNSVSFIDRVDNKTISKYRIKAFKGASYSVPSNTLEFTGIPQPTYFVVETNTINTVYVYFNDRAAGTGTVNGYQIERSDDGGSTYKVIAKKAPGDFDYVPNAHGTLTGYKKFIDTDPSLKSGQTYYYRVAAYNSIALGPYAGKDSASASTMTPYVIVSPGGVPILPGISVSLTQIPSAKVRVTDNSNNETQFEIQKSTDNVNWSNLCFMNSYTGDKNCEDKSITSGGKYYYRARAFNNSATHPSTSNIYASSGFVYSDPVILAGAAPTGVTEWYVWKAATSGTNTGESWANAWQDIDQVNWKAVKPGDTIYISGDNYGKSLSIYGSGVQGKPIKIYTGALAPNPSGHTGKVTLNGIAFNQNASWIDIDGSINRNYTLTSPLNVDDNINLFIDKSPSTSIYSNGSNGVNLRFIKITNSSDFGIYFNGVSDQVEIYGVHIYYTVQAGIRYGYSSPRKIYDALKITKTLIEYSGDDGIQTGGTLTVADTIIRKGNMNVQTGHPDGIQGLNASYLDVHNTTIADREKSSYMIVNEFMMSSAFTNPDFGHIRIYNNEFYYTNPDLSPVTSGIYTSAAIMTPAPVDYENWDDIFIANNTFYNTPKTTPIAFGVREQISKVTAKNIVVKNNLIYDAAKDYGIAIGFSPAITTDSTTRIDNNLAAGASPKMSFGGKIYDTGEAFNIGTGFKGNTSATPKFVNLTGYNLRLASDDTAARGKGENLSQYFSFDKDNNSRPSSGPWDIGAYQGGGTPVVNPIPNPIPNPTDITSGLLLNINFDGDDFSTINNDTNKTITFKDSSGKNYNGTCQTALSLNNILNDQCPQKALGVKSGNSAKFAGNLCDMTSDYIGIPTGGELSYLTKGTVSVYVAFDSMSYLGQHIIDTYTADIKNTWALHLDGDKFPTLTVVDDAGAAVDIITFPTAVKVGDWNHYAFTWDGSYIKAYFNGMYVRQAKMTAIPGLKFFENPSPGHIFGVNYMTLGAMKHNEPRNYPDSNCWTQYGWPKQNYVYPNAGWMTGRIDEVRIYNRDLAQNEISSLASLVSNSGQSTLVVTKKGDGDGDVGTTVAGVGCGKHCAEAFNNGTTLTLKAIPRFNSRFVAWSGGCSGTSATCTITLNSNTQVTANFAKIDPTTITLNANQASSITDPFINIGGSIFQYKTSSISGRAQFDFNLPESGDYSISGLINAPSQGSNSFYINIDDEPDPKVETNGWYIPTTGGYDNRFVNWGGEFNYGVRDANGVSVPKFFTLSAGNHKLIVKGREEGTAFRSFDLIRKGGSTSSGQVTQSSGGTSGSSSNTGTSNTSSSGNNNSGSSSNGTTGNTNTGSSNSTSVITSSDADGDGISNSIDKCPYTKPGVKVNKLGCPEFKSIKYTTPDLSDADLNSVSVLEFANNLGKISYPQGNYNLARNSGDAIDLDSNLNIAKGIVSLNSTQVPELNKPATITLYNITEKSPKIIRDGVECTTCKIISFTNGTLVFTVSGFSTYTVVEGDTGSTSSSGGSSGGTSSNSQNSAVSTPSSSSGSVAVSNNSSNSTSGGVGYANIRPLSITMNDPLVKSLQQKLNAKGYTVTASGPGSKGNETTYFGKATQASLKQYQCAVMKVCSGVNYGVLDQLTYISLFGITATTTVAPSIPVPAGAGKYVFTKTLSLGSTGEDVRQLQIFLNSKGYTIASTGPGSKGNESSYFGNATKKALAKYQADNKIYPSAGLFGPLTKSFVNK